MTYKFQDIDPDKCLKNKKIFWAIVNSRGTITMNGGMFEIFDTKRLAETHMGMGVGYYNCRAIRLFYSEESSLGVCVDWENKTVKVVRV